MISPSILVESRVITVWYYSNRYNSPRNYIVNRHENSRNPKNLDIERNFVGFFFFFLFFHASTNSLLGRNFKLELYSLFRIGIFYFSSKDNFRIIYIYTTLHILIVKNFISKFSRIHSFHLSANSTTLCSVSYTIGVIPRRSGLNTNKPIRIFRSLERLRPAQIYLLVSTVIPVVFHQSFAVKTQNWLRLNMHTFARIFPSFFFFSFGN